MARSQRACLDAALGPLAHAVCALLLEMSETNAHETTKTGALRRSRQIDDSRLCSGRCCHPLR